MNHVLYNISLIVLAVGIILLTVYITRSSTSPYLAYGDMLKKQYEERQQQRVQATDVFDYRYSKVFKDMFSQPSIWQGFQDYKPDELARKTIIPPQGQQTEDERFRANFSQNTLPSFF